MVDNGSLADLFVLFVETMIFSFFVFLCVLVFDVVKHFIRRRGLRRIVMENNRNLMAKCACNSNDIDMLDERLKRLEKQMDKLKSKHLDM